ncbi:uncharacterized protein PRCAT00001123001 [Priceomyces carsonii]|uniref:uncharacterized protein n=1 Tax=Priceomyces carsonii TaxID=28549 RepID=UPI002EDB99F9|nr:unnamed protein product [Priceomyces carsonii]
MQRIGQLGVSHCGKKYLEYLRFRCMPRLYSTNDSDRLLPNQPTKISTYPDFDKEKERKLQEIIDSSKEKLPVSEEQLSLKPDSSETYVMRKNKARGRKGITPGTLITSSTKNEATKNLKGIQLRDESMALNWLSSHLKIVYNKLNLATKSINEITGYSAIEILKKDIESMEDELKLSKVSVKESKKLYMDAIQKRSQSQKEINELLTRRNSWTSQDLERFTELYKNDHLNEQNELSAQQDLNKAEAKVENVQLKLIHMILSRYHEEQVWSDKIRRASTWGTWVLMGINVLLFIAATFLVEPWKRHKLVGSFEEKVKEALTNMSSKEKERILNTQNPVVPKVEHSNLQDSARIVNFPLDWQRLRNSLLAAYNSFALNAGDTVEFTKLDFALMSTIISIISYGLGAAVSLYLK